MSNKTSAHVGQLPATHRDFLVVRGFWRMSTFHTYPSPADAEFPPTIPAPPVTDHHDQTWKVYASTISVLLLISLITCTRLLLRLCKHELRWGSDDWMIIVALVIAVAWGSVVIMSGVNGAGRHLYDITYVDFDRWFAGIAYGPIFFYVALAFAKISICCFNERLTSLTSRSWQIYHRTLLTLLSLYILAVIFAYTFIFYPPAVYLSDIGGRTGHTRLNREGSKMSIAFSAIHAAFDFFLLPVPVVVMFRLRLTASQRARLLVLFSIGLVTVLGAVMRGVVLLSKQKDITYQFPDFNRWSMVDITFSFAVASLPTLNALLPARFRRSGGGASPLYPPDSPSSSSSASGPSKTKKYKLRGGKVVPQVHVTEATETTEGREGDEESRDEESRDWDGNGERDGQRDGEMGEGDVRDSSSDASSVPWEQRQWGRMHVERNGRLSEGGKQPDWEKYAPGLRI